MIVVEVCGGLGNQMFQYASYEYLKRNGNDVYVDISDYEIHRHHQGFELKEIFNLDFPAALSTQIKELAFNHKSILYRLLRKCGIRVSKLTEFTQCVEGLYIPEGKFYRDLYMSGFWQSSAYVEAVEGALRQRFKFVPPLSVQNNDILHLIETTMSCRIPISFVKQLVE